ncbi:hypothetical protein [Haliscomenobacter sp.]|uniref:hypothetical protein n=1 Tax=Haliscomenobacter sp. TaxID=2717303 RepID=UPI0033650282
MELVKFILNYRFQLAIKKASALNLLFRVCFLVYLILLAISYKINLQNESLQDYRIFYKHFIFYFVVIIPFSFSFFPFYQERFNLLNQIYPLSVYKKFALEWMVELFRFEYLAAFLFLATLYISGAEMLFSFFYFFLLLLAASLYILSLKIETEFSFHWIEKISAYFFLSFVFGLFIYLKQPIIGFFINLCCVLILRKRAEFYGYIEGKPRHSVFLAELFVAMGRIRAFKTGLFLYFLGKLSIIVTFYFFGKIIYSELTNPVIWIAIYLMFFPYMLFVSFFFNLWYNMREYWLSILVNSMKKNNILLDFYTSMSLPILLIDFMLTLLWVYFIGYLSIQILIFGFAAYFVLFWSGYFSSTIFAHNSSQESMNTGNQLIVLLLMVFWFVLNLAMIYPFFYFFYFLLFIILVFVFIKHNRWFDKKRYSIFINFLKK